MQIKTVYNDTVKRLQAIYDKGEAEAITRMLMENVSGVQAYSSEEELPFSSLQKIEEACIQLQMHRPIQYVLGHAWFYKLRFKVNEAVLIPRPETEQLCEWIVREFINREPKHFLDVGTGSGCILISLAHHLGKGSFHGIDKSEMALEVATENANDLQVGVSFNLVDFLDETSWGELQVPDVLVSNPPYVPLSDKKTLAKHVAGFEPEIALFPLGINPLIFYERLAEFALNKMQAGAEIFLEIHSPLAAQTLALFKSERFEKAALHKDWFGQERFLYAQLA